MSSKAQQKNRPRLGRGLSSLISVPDMAVPAAAESAAPPQASAAGAAVPLPPVVPAPAPLGKPIEIPIGEVRPNPHQPRKEMGAAGLSDLAASIKATGVIQPIVVKKVDSGYELIAGERRLRAAKQAGLEAIPAIIRDVDSVTQAQMALIENIQREDLNPIDRAHGYRTLLNQLGLTQSELAGRLGEDRSSIANFLRLLELAEPVQAMVRDGRLSVGHAKLLAGVPDILEQQRLAELAVSQGLSVRNLERVLQEAGKGQPARREPAASSAHILDLEKSLSRQLGMRVQVKASARKGKGRLVIHYSSLDQFDDLLSRIGVQVEVE